MFDWDFSSLFIIQHGSHSLGSFTRDRFTGITQLGSFTGISSLTESSTGTHSLADHLTERIISLDDHSLRIDMGNHSRWGYFTERTFTAIIHWDQSLEPLIGIISLGPLSGIIQWNHYYWNHSLEVNSLHGVIHWKHFPAN